MSSSEIPSQRERDFLFLDHYITERGGSRVLAERYVSHLESSIDVMSLVFESILEAAKKTDQLFKDDIETNATAFMEGFAFGYGILVSLNESKGIGYDWDIHYGIANKVIGICNTVNTDKFDATPLDILMAQAKHGFSVNEGFEEYVDKIIDQYQLQPAIKLQIYTKAGIGLAANIVSSYEVYKKLHESLTPSSDDWDKFSRNIGHEM